MMLRLMLLFTVITVDAAAQRLEDITTITFTRQSRAYLDEVVLTPDSVHGVVENHKEPAESRYYDAAMSSDDWARLMVALKDVSLHDVDGLRSPSMNRAHDGAMHSSIVIAFQDSTTVSHSFDDENPHPDLKPLLDAILEHRVPQ